MIDVKLYAYENHKLLKRYKVSLVEAPMVEKPEEEEEKVAVSELEELEQQLAQIEQELAEIRSRKKQ